MAFCLDLRPDARDPAVRIDQERGAGRTPVGLPVVLLLDPGAVPVRDRVILVREQREREAELLAERTLAGRALGADAPHVGAALGDGLVGVAELAGLDRAARACRPWGRSTGRSSGRAGRPGRGWCPWHRAGRPVEPSRRRTASPCSERSRGLDDEELAATQGDGGVGQIADVREAARPARQERLVIQAVGKAVRRDPVGIRPERQERHEIAHATGQIELGRVRRRDPVRPGAGPVRRPPGAARRGTPARASTAGRGWPGRDRRAALRARRAP